MRPGVLVVSALVACLFALTGTALAADGGTRVHVIDPTHPRHPPTGSAYAVVPRHEPATFCSVSFAADDRGYRCFLGHLIDDYCFRLAQPPLRVGCIQPGPLATTLHVAPVRKLPPLPTAPQDIEPMAVRLADGTTCGLLGVVTHPSLRDRRFGDYWCRGAAKSDHMSLLHNSIDTSTATWTARSMHRVGHGLYDRLGREVRITDAYYAIAIPATVSAQLATTGFPAGTCLLAAVVLIFVGAIALRAGASGRHRG